MSSENTQSDMEAMLTPEELEAINDPGMSEQELQHLQKLADASSDNDDDDDSDDDEGDGGDGLPIEGKPAADATDATTASAGTENTEAQPTAQADDEGDTAPQAFVPRYDAKLPEDFDNLVSQLAEHEKNLKKQFKDGEIEFEAYDEAQGKIALIRERLTIQRAKSEISQEFSQQTAEQQWTQTVAGYLKSVRSEIDYSKDPDKAQDLDMFVKRLANANGNENKSAEWFLQEAHKRVKALHGVASKTSADVPQPPKADPIKQAQSQRKPPVSAAPVNLSQVPASDGPNDIEGEFSHLEDLEGDELEEAIGKMTPLQRAKFARA